MSRTSYNTRKTIAQGFLDVALLLSNISQINFIAEAWELQGFRTRAVLGLLGISVILQVVVGIMLMVIAHREQRTVKMLRDHNEKPELRRQLTLDGPYEPLLQEDKFDTTTASINTTISCLIFVILVLNVIVNGLDLSSPKHGVKTGTDITGENPIPESDGAPAVDI